MVILLIALIILPLCYIGGLAEYFLINGELPNDSYYILRSILIICIIVFPVAIVFLVKLILFGLWKSTQF